MIHSKHVSESYNDDNHGRNTAAVNITWTERFNLLKATETQVTIKNDDSTCDPSVFLGLL